MAFSMTAGRDISDDEIKRATKAAKELSAKFSLEGLTDQKDIRKIIVAAGEAFCKRVGVEGGCTVVEPGKLAFTFDNCLLKIK